MWARHLLFLGVVLGGAAILRASLFPLHTPARAVYFDTTAASADDFQAALREVDDAFRAEWKAKGLTPARRAADLIVARRLSLALTGTVPSLEEIRQFEAQPPENRIAGWADHLLQDRRASDYLAERLARAYVGTEDGPFIVYRKRRFLTWISDELHKNTPYDVFVRQMIADHGLSNDHPAVNFITETYTEERKAPDPEKLAIRVSRAFLGLRLDCAQCHDHFLEPAWRQTDFQGLAAFFGQTKQVATVVWDGEGDYRYEDRKHGTKEVIAPAVPFAPELLPNEGTQRERLARWLTHPQNTHFARATVNRTWALMFNRPLLPHVEMQTLDEEGPAALDILAKDFVRHQFDLRRLIRLIAATEVFALDSAAPHPLSEEHDQAWAVFPLTRLRPEQVIGSVIQAGSVQTINRQSHVLTRLARFFNEREFVQRYGDASDEEFDNQAGTIPQRLLMMNGHLVNERAKETGLPINACSQIAAMAPDDKAAVETAYLTVLTRRPTAKELAHFTARLAGTTGDERQRRLADLFWTLFNATEQSWNH
jgi:hypothetical protein